MNLKNFPKRLDSKTSCLRISVPENLDLALEGLIRKVLREQPKTDDIYSFAADYFETLLKIRDNSGAKLTADQLCPFHNDEDAHEMIKLATSFTKPRPKTSEPPPTASRIEKPFKKKQFKPKKPDVVKKLPVAIGNRSEIEFLSSDPIKELVEKELIETKSRGAESVLESVIQSSEPETTGNDAVKPSETQKRTAVDAEVEEKKREETKIEKSSNVEAESETATEKSKEPIRQNVKEISNESNEKTDTEQEEKSTVVEADKKTTAGEVHQICGKENNEALESEKNTKNLEKPVNVAARNERNSQENEDPLQISAEETNKEITEAKKQETGIRILKEKSENVENKITEEGKDLFREQKNQMNKNINESTEAEKKIKNEEKSENEAAESEAITQDSKGSIKKSEEAITAEITEAPETEKDTLSVKELEKVVAEYKNAANENGNSLQKIVQGTNKECDENHKTTTEEANQMKKPEKVIAENGLNEQKIEETFREEVEGLNRESYETPETAKTSANVEKSNSVAVDGEAIADKKEASLQRHDTKKDRSEASEIKSDLTNNEKLKNVAGENKNYSLPEDKEKTSEIPEMQTDEVNLEKSLNVAAKIKTVIQQNESVLQNTISETNKGINEAPAADKDSKNIERHDIMATDNEEEKKNILQRKADEINTESNQAPGISVEKSENEIAVCKTVSAKLDKEPTNVVVENTGFSPRSTEINSTNTEAGNKIITKENKTDKTKTEETTHVEEENETTEANPATQDKAESKNQSETATTEKDFKKTTEPEGEETPDTKTTTTKANVTLNILKPEEQPKNAAADAVVRKKENETHEIDTGDKKSDQLNNNLQMQPQTPVATQSSTEGTTLEMPKDHPTEELCRVVDVREIPESKSPNEEELCTVVDIQQMPKNVKTPEKKTLRVGSPQIIVEEVEKGSQPQEEKQIKTIQTHYYNILQVPEVVTKEYRLHSVVTEAMKPIQEPTSPIADDDDLMTPTSVSSLNLSELSWRTVTGIFLDSEKSYSSFRPNETQPIVEEIFYKTVVPSGIEAVPDPPRDSHELNEGNVQEDVKNKPENASSDESKSTDSDVAFISVEVKTVIETQILDNEDEKKEEEEQPEVEVKVEATIDVLDEPEIEKQEMSDGANEEKTDLEHSQDKSQQDKGKGSSSTEQTTAKEGSSGESESTLSSAATEIKRTDSEKRSLGSARSLLSTQSLDYGKRNPLVKTRSLSAFRHGVTDFEVWNAIERELEEAATKIQSKFRGYKTRKKLQRENAVQITTEESPVSTTPVEAEAETKDERQPSTGEFHDSIILSEHPR